MKESIQEIKDRFKKDVIRSSYPIKPSGGQTCGIPVKGITLKCNHTDFSISICSFRSQFQNLELAMTLYSLYLDEIVK